MCLTCFFSLSLPPSLSLSFSLAIALSVCLSLYLSHFFLCLCPSLSACVSVYFFSFCLSFFPVCLSPSPFSLVLSHTFVLSPTVTLSLSRARARAHTHTHIHTHTQSDTYNITCTDIQVKKRCNTCTSLVTKRAVVTKRVATHLPQKEGCRKPALGVCTNS